MVDHIANDLGHTVNIGDRAALTESDFVGIDAFFLSPRTSFFTGTIPPGDVDIKEYAIPALIMSGDRADAMFKLGSVVTDFPSETVLNIVDTTTPLSAGFPLGPVTVASVGQDYAGFSALGAGGIGVGTTLSNPKFILAKYDIGDLLADGSTAAEARVYMSMGVATTYEDLTVDGKSLFDTAISYTLTGAGIPVPGWASQPLYAQGNPNVLLADTSNIRVTFIDDIEAPTSVLQATQTVSSDSNGIVKVPTSNMSLGDTSDIILKNPVGDTLVASNQTIVDIL